MFFRLKGRVREKKIRIKNILVGIWVWKDWNIVLMNLLCDEILYNIFMGDRERFFFLWVYIWKYERDR